MRSTTYMGILTATFVALFPFLISDHLFYGAENLKYFFFVGFIDLLLVWTGVNIWNKKIAFSPSGKWFLGSSIFVLVILYLAGLLGVNISHSFWSDILRSTGLFFITHVAIGMYLLATNLKQKDWSIIRKTVAVSAAVFSFIVFIGSEGFGLTGSLLWFSLNTSGSTIANTTFAAAYAVLALIIAFIELSRTDSNDPWRWGLIGSVTMILISPLLIGSNLLFNGTSFSQVLNSPSLLLGSGRSSSVVAYALLFFMGGILLLRKLPKEIKNLSLWGWAITWLLAITIGLTLLFTPGSFVQKEYIKASTGARIVLWEEGIRAVGERPILGWGQENFVYAFEKYFDNRLFSKEFNSETWFDRSHNVFIDTLVTSGVAGVLSFVLLVLAIWGLIYRAYKKALIEYFETILLAVFPIAHIVQLQTAFDTTVTYGILSIIGGYLIWLEYQASQKEGKEFILPDYAVRALAIGLIILATLSTKFLIYDEWIRQSALFTTFNATKQAQRVADIKTSLSGPGDFEILRLSSGSFIKGLLVQIRTNALTQQTFTASNQLIDIYSAEYERYIDANPTYYRARIDYAYLLFIKTMMGRDSLEQAKEILKDSYQLAPSNPLTYGLDALAEIYGGNFDAARKKADAGLALNPDVDFSKIIRAYVDDQEKSFPSITILELQNI